MAKGKSSEAKKALRAKSVARCATKKTLNREFQAARESANRSLPPDQRPWALAKARRAAARRPLQEAWRHRNGGSASVS